MHYKSNKQVPGWGGPPLDFPIPLVCFAHVLSNMMQLPPTPPLSQKCTVKQVSTMHTWTCMKPQHQLPLLDTSLLHTQDSTTQLHDSRVSKQTRGQSHTILFLKFSLKDRNIIYDEFFLLCRYLCAVARCHVVGMQNPPYLCCLSPTRPQRSQLCGCDV